MKKIFFVFAFLFLALSCSKDEPATQDDDTNQNFDRSAMLINWADGIIIPSFQNFETSVISLQDAVNAFHANQTSETLATMRQAWRNTYISFQNVSMFELGPAENVSFRVYLNSYPTDVNEINGFIDSGEYNLELPSTIDSQGFPALDYLLYGVAENDTEVLQYYEDNQNARDYLLAVSQRITSLTSAVVNGWSSFRNDFVNNDGASASASVDKLTNDFMFYYEKALRAGKIGIPAGVFSNEPLPQNVEGLYTQNISKELTIEALDACIRFFRGQGPSGGATGEGYETYLNFLNSIKNGDDLGNLILNQFSASKNAINGLNANFAAQISTDNNAMLTAYDELQRNVVLLKVDMLQALSIDVDFVDADGD